MWICDTIYYVIWIKECDNQEMYIKSGGEVARFDLEITF